MDHPNDLPPDSAGNGNAHPPDGEAAPDRSKLTPILPFPKFIPALAGATAGLILRLIFSAKPGGVFTAMSGTFILLAPIVVGAVTIYVAESISRRSWRYYVIAGALANLMFVLGTMAILIEGLICVLIIAPMFAVLGGLSGLAMGAVCRYTNWPKPATYGITILPLVLALALPTGAEQPLIGEVSRSIQVDMSADAIWQQLLTVRDIRKDEVGSAWMYRIGVPLPLAGVTEQTPTGLVRHVVMGKSIHFDQFATDWQTNRFVRWKYRFSDDSFPPNALDDHVKIGGQYFDLIDTEYSITPLNERSSVLKIRMHYRVSTQFNWYANGVAQLLMGNFEEVILKFYRHRSENS